MSHRYRWLFSALSSFFVISCGANPSPPTTPAAKEAPASVVAPVEDRDREQAETRERNRNQPPFTPAELRALIDNPTHQVHLKLWKDTRSYYALLEITEGIIEPEIGRLRRQDIQELLGKGSTDYPNSHGRMLEYAGDRQVPYGEHLLIHSTIRISSMASNG